MGKKQSQQEIKAEREMIAEQRKNIQKATKAQKRKSHKAYEGERRDSGRISDGPPGPRG